MRCSLPITSALLLCFTVTAAGQQSQETQPVSIGIVLDTSGSMGARMALARRLVLEVAKSAGSLDEFALIQASDRPVVLSGFVGAGDVPAQVSFIQSKGRSAILDGIYLGSQFMKASRNARKVLLVISDGGENSSRYTAAEIRDSIRAAGVRFYAIGTNGLPIDEAAGPALLLRMAEQAGGIYFGAERTSHLPMIAQELNAAMRARP